MSTRAVAVWSGVCLLVVSACQAVGPPANAEYPSLQMPTRLASDPPRHSPSDPPVAPPATSSQRLVSPSAAAAADGRSQGDPPDPSPLSERAQWRFPVAYDRGVLRVGDPTFDCLDKAQATGRRMGRFAFELWLGRELIERRRFDFPLLATETPRVGRRQPLRETPSFAPGARVSIMLPMPASERATTARILDRATGDSVTVPWPPSAPSNAISPQSCRTSQTTSRATPE